MAISANDRIGYVCAQINCDPVPLYRPRFDTKRGRVYEDKRCEAGRNVQALLLAQHTPKAPLEGPVSVGLTYYLAMPAKGRKPGPHDVRPDVDNLAKLTIDVLTRLQWFKDDKQVAELHVVKRWSPTPGVRVEVWSLL